LRAFLGASHDLLRKFHGLAKLPALPLPKGTGKASAASKDNWGIGHPDTTGTILNDPGSGLAACLAHWFDLADAANEKADDAMRADIANLVSTVGGRDFVMHNPIKVAAEFARDPVGIGLRSFERKLFALERIAAMPAPQSTAGGGAENGAAYTLGPGVKVSRGGAVVEVTAMFLKLLAALKDSNYSVPAANVMHRKKGAIWQRMYDGKKPRRDTIQKSLRRLSNDYLMELAIDVELQSDDIVVKFRPMPTPQISG
jgi:hypothetical protein